MDQLEIIENVEGMLIHHMPTDRYFRFECPEKFNVYGFAGLNTQDTLIPKLMEKDFAYSIDSTWIYIRMTLTNGTRTYEFETKCEEIFADDWINLDMEHLEPNVSKYIKSLKSKVNNLSLKIKELEDIITK